MFSGLLNWLRTFFGRSSKRASAVPALDPPSGPAAAAPPSPSGPSPASQVDTVEDDEDVEEPEDDTERDEVDISGEGAEAPSTGEATDVEGSGVALDDEFFSAFIDNRDKAPKEKRKRFAHGPNRVNGIVLHQMAVNRPDSSKRFHLVTGHFVVTMGGRIHWNHDLKHYLYHGDGFNRSTIGIELAGNFEGIEGSGRWYKPEKFGRNVPTPIQLKRTKQLLKWLKEVHGPEEGYDLTRIYAHRQSSKSRAGDPGSRVWRECGIWAQEELGMSDGGPGYVKGGLPIEESWDSRDRSSES